QYQPIFHPDIAAPVGEALGSDTPAVKNDEHLGHDVTGLNPDPHDPPNPALSGTLWLRHDGFANIERIGAVGIGGQDVVMQLKHTTPGDWIWPDASAQKVGGSVEVSLSLKNWALRFLGVYLQFLSTQKDPPTPIPLKDIEEYRNKTIVPGRENG